MTKPNVATEAIRNRAKGQVIGSVARHTLKEGESLRECVLEM
jgi:hypothetical protein